MEWNCLILESKRLAWKKFSLNLQQSIQPRYIFGSKGTQKGKFRGLGGICSLSNEIIVCDQHNHRIQIFDLEGKFIHKFDLKTKKINNRFYYPIGICTLGTNLVVAYSREIEIFSHDYQVTHSIPFDTFSINTIACTRQGQILVTNYPTISIVNRKGNIVKKLDFFEKNNLFFITPGGTCTNSRAQILITDSSANKVYVFSQDGEFLSSFGSNQLQYPQGICVDTHDNVFVCDYKNHRVSIFDPKGNPLTHIPVRKPLNLCLLKDRLIVTSQENRITIFSN